MIEMTPELAEFCGIHAGDGYMRTRNGNKGEIDISGNFEEKEYYDSHVIPLFNSIFGLNVSGKFFNRKTYGFVCYRKEPRTILKELGFPNGKKSSVVRVPEQVISSDNILLFSRFLRGLFDTDGCISFRKSYLSKDARKNKYNHYPTVRLFTVSFPLAEGVMKMLNKMQIDFYYYSDSSRQSKAHIIAINGVDGINRWMQMVGTKNKVKLSRYLVWEKFGFCPSNLTLNQREDILNGRIDPFLLAP